MGKPVNIQQCVITQLIVALEKNVIASSDWHFNSLSRSEGSCYYFSTTTQGVYSQDFSKGGYTVSNRGYSLDCHVPCHVYPNVTNKKTYKGRIQATQDPPSYALGPAPYKPITQNIYITNKWNTTT